MMKELESTGKTRAEVEMIASIEVGCRAMVEALCLTRGKEDCITSNTYNEISKTLNCAIINGS